MLKISSFYFYHTLKWGIFKKNMSNQIQKPEKVHQFAIVSKKRTTQFNEPLSKVVKWHLIIFKISGPSSKVLQVM